MATMKLQQELRLVLTLSEDEATVILNALAEHSMRCDEANALYDTINFGLDPERF